MRRKVNNRHIVEPDFVYNSQKLEKFINCIMFSGKKETARKVMYATLDTIKEKTGNPNPLEMFDLAIKNVGPATEVRSQRIGGANSQGPPGSSTSTPSAAPSGTPSRPGWPRRGSNPGSTTPISSTGSRP